MDREDVPLHKLVWSISNYAIDPSLEASPIAIKRFEEYAGNLRFDQWRSTYVSTREDHDIDQAEVVLARYVPRLYALKLKQGVRQIGDRNDKGKRQLLICFGDISQIIGADERQEIEAILEQYRKDMEQLNSAQENKRRDREHFAEANGTLAQVMHMSPDTAIEYLLNRPANAQDLLKLGKWIHPISLDKQNMLIKLMETELDDKKLIRILWMLYYIAQDLRPSQETKLLQYLDSENKTVRSLALQLAISSRSGACFSYIINNKNVFQYSRDSWDADWCGWIFANHGHALTVTELASRIPLSYLGDAVEARGMKESEVKEYAELVHQLWQDISQTNANENIELPTLEAEKEEQHGAIVTWLKQQSEYRTIKFQSAISSCGGQKDDFSVSRLKELFNANDDKAFNERERRFWETVEELRTRKENTWWLSSFNSRTLSEIAHTCPVLVEQWINKVLNGTLDAEILLSRCSGFYQSLCFALASSNPEQGFKLWELIRNRHSPIRFINPYTGTDWVSGLPFSVEYSPQADTARQKVLEGCFSDISLLELTGAALGFGQGEWIITQAQQLVRSENLSERAKGITLCCLADADNETVSRLIADADIDRTWVADILLKLRAYHDHNKWAQHWYRRFLYAGSQDESWCAFRLFLKCVDRRWRKRAEELEQELNIQQSNVEWRIRFRKTMNDKIQQAVEKNEKPLKEVYLSIKFHRGELIPFE